MKTFFGILVLLWTIAVAAAKTRSGVGTAYAKPGQMDKTGRNACGYNPKKLPKKYQTYFAALNEGDFKKMGRPCGKCIKATGARTRGGKAVYAKIVDICPSKYCKKGHVDFSTKALKAITGYEWDKKPIRWQLTSCP